MEKMDSKTENIHAGHRERIRERFRREGLNAFSDHEVLELLLTFAIPQRDVNPLAHMLLAHFGSLSGVFNADESELLSVRGIGANAALLIALVLPLLSRYEIDQLGERPQIVNLATATHYCRALMRGAQEERIYMLCLDQAGHVQQTVLLRSGTLDEVTLYPREVVQISLRHQAHAILLAHNHPSGVALPSQADYEITTRIVNALGTVDVRVVDHLILSPSGVYSMSQHSQMGDDNLSDDFSYVTRSANVPGRRGTLRAEDGESWRFLAVEDFPVEDAK